MRQRRGTRRVACLAACVLVPSLAACAKSDVQSELDRTRSWTATTRLAADRRAARATNAAVTSQILQRATTAEANATQAFARLARTDSERTAARVVLDSLHEGILQLERVAQ